MSRTILVVDDKDSVRTLLREFLTAQHFRVATAANGREALLVARQAAPDLVILDVMMPEMDGYEFIRHYRRECDSPIILLTAKEVQGLRVGTIVMTGSQAELDSGEREFLTRTNRTLLAAMLGGGLSALLIGVVLTQLLTRPIRALTSVRCVNPVYAILSPILNVAA